jgi:lipoprotein-anchoring transpeptidase ErfK/SrfK
MPSIPGDVFIVVNKNQQTMKIYKGDVLIYTWLCSTGKQGYVTPPGNYKPYHVAKMHYSRKWDMAPMPYSVFYYKGFAIHGTNYTRNLGRRASHGCIRLSTANAKKVYHLAKRYGYKRVHIKVA